MDKMKKNKSIDRLTPQKNLYNALVEAYEADKDILETYGDTVTFKRHRDDHDEDEEKRRRAGKEPESTSAPKERTSKITGKSTEGSKSHHKEDPRESFDEMMDTPLDFSAFVMNRLNVDTLTPELLAGLTFELMKGTFVKLYRLITSSTMTFHIYMVLSQAEPMQLPLRRPRLQIMVISNGLKSWESAHDVYFRCRIIVVTKLQIVEWHGYKHLDWIIVHRDDDKLYTFNEGDFKRLRLQDIEDMLIFLVQDKLTNLNVEERLAFSVSL
ncbi:hypothetical protein Tco_1270714 [Tanacetum coccineum]